MYQIPHISADSNVNKINFALCYKLSQRITRNGSVLHAHRLLSKNSFMDKKMSQYADSELWN